MTLRLTLAAATLLLGTAPVLAQGPMELAFPEIDGEVLCTVHARGVDPRAIIAPIAKRLDKDVVDYDRRPADPIDVYLQERSTTEVVHAVLGSAGLRARITTDSIEIYTDADPGATADDFDDLAEIGYLRALRHHSSHPLGAEAEMSLAEIHERRGNLSAAASHYSLVVDNFSDSEWLPDALLRAGKLFMRLEQWHDGAHMFAELAERPELAKFSDPHPYAVDARLSLATCTLEIGDPRQSLFMLDALDNLYPADEVRDVQRRLFVRARVLVGLGQHDEALRHLTWAEGLLPDPNNRLESLELRGLALEGLGRSSEASRAWLQFAASAEPRHQERAFGEAARLALKAGDELAAILIHDSAEQAGVGTAARVWGDAARERLGLVATGLTAGDLEQALTRAESLLREERYGNARVTVERHFLARSSLSPAARIRCVSLYARGIYGERGVEAAVEILRNEVRATASRETRTAYYLLAAELYELAGRMDAAIEAYGGRL